MASGQSGQVRAVDGSGGRRGGGRPARSGDDAGEGPASARHALVKKLDLHGLWSRGRAHARIMGR
jgi:hypothetical protein